MEIDGYTLPDHLAPCDATLPDLAETLVEEWGELMEWGVLGVEGGAEVV